MQWFGLVPIGLYQDRRSFLHAADPRSKLLFVILYLALAAVSKSVSDLSLLGITAVLLLFGSRLPPGFLWHRLTGLLPLLAVLVLYRLLTSDPGDAAAVLFQFLYYVVAVSSLGFTTSPQKLVRGLAALMSPLRRVRLPVDRWVMMATVAIRFLPLLIEAADAMLLARRLRDARRKGGFRNRLRSLSEWLVALLMAAFRRADQLAIAMEARGYAPGNRVGQGRLRFGWRDGLLAGFMLALLLARLWGWETAKG